ncbi:MAG: hypothetical protein JRG71_14540, partial [Deltaproteobacteria bacterium]|nr:hypothetical protein [Deltaproteobacteria bacterium]
MNILDLAQTYIADLKRKTVKEWVGPCPNCGGTDRFMVWVERNKFNCRGCGATGGPVAFLCKFGNMSCPDAHDEVGEDCNYSSCPVWDKC